MAEISELEPNGFKVASTFSGAGGSSLGYRMAGFSVVWASEFIPAAAEVYELNKAPYTVLDRRDIREVSGREILEASGVEDIDLLDGSPPCASFSTAGKREAGWGHVKKYSDGSQRVDDLFFEFARILGELKPKTFVAENVSGLVKGTAKGYFKRILSELRGSGYNVRAKLLDAQWLGVPQARQRLIFVGVRNDLGLEPVFPKPLPYRYSVRDAIPWIRKIEGANGFDGHAYQLANKLAATIQQSRTLNVEAEAWMSRYATGREWEKLSIGEQSERYFQLVKSSPDKPVGTITASGGGASLASVSHPYENRKFSIAELKRLCGFPDDFKLSGTYAQQWERLGRAVPPVMMAAIARAVLEGVLWKIK